VIGWFLLVRKSAKARDQRAVAAAREEPADAITA